MTSKCRLHSNNGEVTFNEMSPGTWSDAGKVEGDASQMGENRWESWTEWMSLAEGPGSML